MTLRRIGFSALALAATILACPPASAADLDIKRIAPSDAHTAMYAKKNEERAYQDEYLADAWKTFQDERICERIFELVKSRAPKEEMAKFEDAWKQVETALDPISLQALVDSEEIVVANIMMGPFGHTVMAVRLSAEDAEDYRNGVGNLFELFQKWSKDEVTAESTDSDGVKTVRLKLPTEVPYQPAVASIDDLFIVCTSDALLERCLAQLQDDSASSKFDDERFKAALEHLPEPDDSVTFFDANQLFAGMSGIGDFIREHHGDGDDAEHVERGIKILEKVIDEVDVIEYEVIVQYTDEGQNRASALGELADDLDGKILGRALAGGEAFEDWKSWVPKDAKAYSMNTGINLHELYAGVLGLVREEVPESHEGLDKWTELQEKVGVDLDKDLLQSFSGENVSVTLSNDQSVTALKCGNAEKVRELLDRAIEGLKQIPQVQSQELELVDSDDEALEGFQEVRAAALAMSPVKPVIGFRDGWMIIASSPEAAKTLLAVRAGEEDSIAKSESLERFDLNTDGEVYAVSYSDIGAGIRAFADGIDQVAMMAPMFIGMAAQGAKPEDMKTIQGVIGLLPSFAKVIRKFDYMEQQLTITRGGPEENTYLRESVMLIRQPSEN